MSETKTSKQQVCQACLENQPLKIRISFFFDGTGNNKENSEAGKSDKDAEGSYAGDLTNITRLHTTLLTESDKFDHHLKAYTEGIGTETLSLIHI